MFLKFHLGPKQSVCRRLGPFSTPLCLSHLGSRAQPHLSSLSAVVVVYFVAAAFPKSPRTFKTEIMPKIH
jgi:hypothetical protein